MLLDTNIFIDLLRGYKPAIDTFKMVLHGQKASCITKFELIIGVKDKKEMNYMFRNLDITNTDFLSVTPEISEKAEFILRSFYLSHGINIEDSLVAATALVHDEELVTRNTKHFDFIPNLKLITPY